MITSTYILNNAKNTGQFVIRVSLRRKNKIYIKYEYYSDTICTCTLSIH